MRVSICLCDFVFLVVSWTVTFAYFLDWLNNRFFMASHLVRLSPERLQRHKDTLISLHTHTHTHTNHTHTHTHTVTPYTHTHTTHCNTTHTHRLTHRVNSARSVDCTLSVEALGVCSCVPFRCVIYADRSGFIFLSQRASRQHKACEFYRIPEKKALTPVVFLNGHGLKKYLQL